MLVQRRTRRRTGSVLSEDPDEARIQFLLPGIVTPGAAAAAGL
ncbi:hypothetical protein ACFWAY_20990 [Rhodococcus sp. NPDC059968]